MAAAVVWLAVAVVALVSIVTESDDDPPAPLVPSPPAPPNAPAPPPVSPPPSSPEEETSILDGAFGIAVTELTAIGREEWPAVTMIVFRNYQWGAEKRNSTLWYEDNFIGTELDDKVSYAGIAQACGLQGVQARTMDELTAALHTAVEDQMKHGKTTLIEAMINQELGEPFRRDAMKNPVAVAGISADDMRVQTVE